MRRIRPNTAEIAAPLGLLGRALRRLVALMGAALLLHGAGVRADVSRVTTEAYDPNLLETRFHFGKSQYVVGEPIYWEVEFYNRSRSTVQMRFTPSYQDDVFLEVFLPDSAGFRYGGTDPIGFKASQAHNILLGERRFFHFRVYYDDDSIFAHPSKLLFFEPTHAIMKPRVKYSVFSTDQVYSPDIGMPLEIVEPVGRDAECLRLISDPKIVSIIHEMKAPREDFALLENILHLYSDTVYAPHIAIALANGYYFAAIEDPDHVDERLLRQAIGAYTVLLQVEDIPYIKELSMFMIASAYNFLGNREAFVAWFRKYLETYGQRGRFSFSNSKIAKDYIAWRDPEWGEFWYLFP